MITLEILYLSDSEEVESISKMWQGDVRKQQELYNNALMLQMWIVPETSCWIMSYLETSIALGHLIHGSN